ncbi:MAG: hypothetical protein IPN34_01695 [Planctomycetes bacterium]|nr:hypothetical protein [Planctomycetota bacterium]
MPNPSDPQGAQKAAIDPLAIARDYREVLVFLRAKCVEILTAAGTKPMERVVALKLLAESLRVKT